MFGVYSQQGGASITLGDIIITSSNSYVYTSLDGGVTWTTITVGSGSSTDILIWGNNEFVFVRSNTFFTSPDGITWTNTGVTLTNINKFIYADGYYFVSSGGASSTMCYIRARESFSSGNWTIVHTAPTTGRYVETLTYYNGSVYFIQQSTLPTFHSILISNLTVTNYGVVNSGLGTNRFNQLHRVHNGWVASGSTRIAYTTTNTGWSYSSIGGGNKLILVTDTTFTPARDYVALFDVIGFPAGLRYDGTGSTGSNSMRNSIRSVYSDGVYFYCYDTASVAGLYRRLITDWTGVWTRDADATTAGINSNFTLMASGGTPNNVYITNGTSFYKTIIGSGTYTNLGAHSGTLKFVGRV